MSFIDRLLNEKAELHHRLRSLEKFISTDDFEKMEQVNKSLIRQQATAMASYLDILHQRLTLQGQNPYSEPPATSKYIPIDELHEIGEFDDRPLDFKD